MKPEGDSSELNWHMKRARECAQAVGEILKSQPGISYDRAWELAAQQNPELFKGEKEQAPAAKAGNELASKARAQAVAQVVHAVQASHPRLSFEESWQIAKAKHADLFEGSIAEHSSDNYAEFRDRCDALEKKLAAAAARCTASGSVKVIGIRQEI